SWRQADEVVFSPLFLYQDRHEVARVLFLARASTVILAVLLALCGLKWAEELCGPQAGVGALFLLVFEPHTLAHSRLATLDIGLATFTFISIYCLWKWLETRAATYAMLTSIAVGFSMLSKYTALAFLPIYIAVFFLHRRTLAGRPSSQRAV